MEEFTAEVPPAGLIGSDVIVRDPDNPDKAVRWRIEHLGWEGPVRIADYVTEDGTEGRHGWEPGDPWPTVRVRTIPSSRAAA